MSTGPSSNLLIVIIIASLVLKFVIVLMNSAMDSVSRKAIKKMAAGSEKLNKLLDLIGNPYKYRYGNFFLAYFFFGIGLIGSLLYTDDYIGILIYFCASIVFTELIPRKLGTGKSLRLATGLFNFQRGLCIVTFPIIFLMLSITNFILRIFRQDTKVEDNIFSEEQVLEMLEVGQETGVIKEEGKKMINSIFQFDDLHAYEIMTPRTNVFAIDVDDPISDYLDKLMELRYSRIPVYEEELDNIVGILNIKDFLIKAWQLGFNKVPIRDILRKAYFIPETKKIDSLFVELQKERQHIAIIIDEYGGFSGIVTMEDIVEEVMGDIDDEYDVEEEEIKKIGKDLYIIDGNAYLDDINEAIGTDLNSEDSETIGGYIIDTVGEIPHEGKGNFSLFTDDLGIEVLSVRDRRIGKIRLRKLNK